MELSGGRLESSGDKRSPLLLFLAAGASLDLGIPSTSSLTKVVEASLDCKNPLPQLLHSDVVEQHLGALKESLVRTYGSPNFEHYQHGLESLSALSRSLRPSTAARYKVIEASLTSGLHNSFPPQIDATWLIWARQTLLEAIHGELSRACQAMTSNPQWHLVSDFLHVLNKEFDLYIVTTNYDDIVERVLGLAPGDQGFVDVEGESAQRFQGQERPPKLMHLHGSLCFGYRKSCADPNRFIYEDDHEDLYLHQDPKQAIGTWFGRSGQTSMAGRETQIGPLVTGLQKPDKLLAEPYMSYFRHFQALCSRTPRILIVGYGFGDQHLNAIISRYGKWHGANRRVAVIDYFEEEKWCPSDLWDERRKPMWRVVAQLAAERHPMDRAVWPDPWVSAGNPAGSVEVYFRGFAGTIDRYQERIIKFLKS